MAGRRGALRARRRRAHRARGAGRTRARATRRRACTTRAGARVLRTTSRGHVERIERDASGSAHAHHPRRAARRPPCARLARARELRALPRGGRIQHDYDPLGRVARRWATSPGSLRPVRFDDPEWASAAPHRRSRTNVTAEREYTLRRRGRAVATRSTGAAGGCSTSTTPPGRLLSVLQRGDRRRRSASGTTPPATYEAEGEARASTGTGGACSGAATTTYAWDDAGRLSRRSARDGGADVWRYTWDAAGRLAARRAAGRAARRVRLRSASGGALEARSTRCVRRRARRSPSGRASCGTATRSRTPSARVRRPRATPSSRSGRTASRTGASSPGRSATTIPDGYGGRRSAWSFFVNDPIGTPDELVGGDGERARRAGPAGVGADRAVEGRGRRRRCGSRGSMRTARRGCSTTGSGTTTRTRGCTSAPTRSGSRVGCGRSGTGSTRPRWIDPLGLAVFIVDPSGQCAVLGTKTELENMGVTDGHHIVQDAAVRNLPGYSPSGAPCIGLPGPPYAADTSHGRATKAQRQAKGGGTLRQELDIGESALLTAGAGPGIAKTATDYAQADFATKGFGPSTPTRVPGNRR